MFKKFLASITDYIIGNYVENFNGENLSYGLLNGNITLSNLTLKKDTLNSLFNIPLTLQSGTVGNVSIFVPYTHPWSQAWQLSLENVDLIAYASADDLWDKLNPNNSPSDSHTSLARNETSKDSLVNNETTQQQSQRDNLSPTDTSSIHGKYSLDKMEKKWFQTINGVVLSDTAAIAELVAMDNRGDNSSWWSYISSVGYGIIRSLQIEIRQVRISLIDPNSSSGTVSGNNSSESEHTFCHDDCPSFGIFTITLEHLTMETTDSCWKRTTSTSQEPVEYKLINVRGLNITWHPDLSKSSIHSIDCTVDEKVTDEASIETEEPSNQSILHILPPCHLTGRLKRKQTNISINNATTNTANTTSTTTTNSTLVTGPLTNRKKYQSEYYQSSEAQIELALNLSQLDIQISQELCRSLLHLSEVLKCQYERTEQLKRRPCSSSSTTTTMKRYADWWRYAAGEVHPPLRLYLNSTFRHVTLSSLANEAKLNIIYVKAYTAYLIKGLSSSSSPSSSSGETLTSTSTTKCLITIDQVSVICKSLNYTPEMDSERSKHDELWSIQRIAILRLIAMRRATVILHKLLKCDKNGKHGSKRSSVDSGQPSGTPLPLPPPPPRPSVVDSTSPASTTTSNQSYYNSWWRYSSWLGLTTSSFFSSNNVDSTTDQTADEAQLQRRRQQQQENEEEGESTADSSFNHSTSSSSSPPSSSSASIILADTIFELLDEFAEHTNNNIDYTSINYPVFLQFICTIDGCSLRLIDSQQEEAMHAYAVHPAFVSMSGEQMNFSLVIRPKCNSYRISTYIQSFTVHDERWSSAQRNSSRRERDSSQLTPLFPVVVYPSYHQYGCNLESDATTANVTADDAQERRVFSLIYEVNPVKINADYVLEIHTDPLQVICQPELLRHIINFIKSVVHSSKPSKQFRLNHSVKEGISLNLSSLIKDTDTNADTTDNNDISSIGSGGVGGKNIPLPKKSTTFTSSSSSSAAVAPAVSSVKSRNRWAINFDLAAPRILFPNRFNIYGDEEGQQKKADNNATTTTTTTTLMSTSLSLCTCVLCDFGHLRVTNWPEVQFRSMKQKKCSNVVLSAEMNSMRNPSVLDNLSKLENEKFPAVESLDAAAAADDDDDDDYDDADEYKTPCSTPGELSDNDDNENNNNIEDGNDDVNRVEKSSQRRNEPPIIASHSKVNEAEKSLPTDNTYTSYMINIDNIRVLVGSLHTLETLGLWSQFNSIQVPTELQDEKEKPPLHPTSLPSPSDSHSVLRMSKSALVSRLCLINPFDLRLLISRRIPTLQHTSKMPKSSSSYSIIPTVAYLPYLWISLIQPSCVIQLSNTKISDFYSCLKACQRQWDQSHPSQQHSQSCSNIHQTMNFTASTPSLYKSIHDNSQQTTTTKPCQSSHRVINHQHDEKYSLKSIISSNAQRIQIIATYSIQSFIIQFESKDRPLAECRLDGAVVNWSVYRDCLADYSVQFKLGSISIVDAVSNLGGLYDVILNSDKVKRADAIESMIAENNNNDHNGNNNGDDDDDGGSDQASVVFNSKLPFSLWKNYTPPLPDHINPLDEFKPFNSQIEQSDTFLMACLTWCPSSSSSSKLNRANKTTPADSSIGSYFIKLSMGYLKITGNPITIRIINEFITDLSLSLTDHYSRDQMNSSDRQLDDDSSQSSFSHHYYFQYDDSFIEADNDTSLSPFIEYNWQISLTNLDILLISHPMSNNNNNVYHSLTTASVKEIVQMTFSNLRLELQTSGLLNSLSIKLRTFQLHPLCNSQIQSDQYLFGSIFPSSSSSSPSSSCSSTVEQHSDLMLINIQWNTQHNGCPSVELHQPQIQITLSNLVYIHSYSDILEIIQWFQCIMPYLRLNKTVVIQSSHNAHIDSDNNRNEISSRLDKLFSFCVQYSIKINNSIILIPSSFNPCAHFSLFSFKQIQINHNFLKSNSMFNCNSSDSKSVSFSIEKFSIMHYVNEAVKAANQFLLGTSPPMEKKLFHLNFRLLYEFWRQQMMCCNDPMKYESFHQVIVFPMDFSIYINYIKLNPARTKSYSSSSPPSSSWLQTVRFNFCDLSIMQTAKLNQFTKYHLVVGGENNGEMNTSSTPPPPPPTTTSSTVPSTNRSVEAATTCSPSVNLLLFSEPITSQLTIVFYIHTLRFNLTKMNCDLVKDLFDNYLLKQFEENQSNNGMNNEEALHTDQAVIQQPSYSDLNSIPIGLNNAQCGSLEFGIRVNCSQIHILMLGDLDITPIPLASLTIESLEASSSVHLSKGGITLPTCLQLTVNRAYLQNRLPPSKHDHDKERRKGSKTSTTRCGIKKNQQLLLVCKDYGHAHKDNKHSRRKRINSCSTEDYDKIYYTERDWCCGNYSICGRHHLSSVGNHDDNGVCGLLQHQVSPISVRVILLSDQHESFCQTKYFVMLSMDTLDFRLLSEPWVLLLDFLNLYDDYKEEAVKETVGKLDQDTIPSCYSNSSPVATKSIPISINNYPKLCLLLDINSVNCIFTEPSKTAEESLSNSDSSDKVQSILTCGNLDTDLAVLSSHGIKLQVNYTPSVDATTATATVRCRSVDVGGEHWDDIKDGDDNHRVDDDLLTNSCLQVEGHMYSIKLIALPRQYASLYGVRLMSASTQSTPLSVDSVMNTTQLPFLVFQFNKAKKLSSSPPPTTTTSTNRCINSTDKMMKQPAVNNNANLRIHLLSSVSYIHTHSFLMSIINTLQNCIEQYTSLKQTRYCVKGLQMPTSADITSLCCLHLNISAHHPMNLIIPVCSTSSKVLVINMLHGMKIVNTFLWNNNTTTTIDSGDPVGVNSGSMETLQSKSSHTNINHNDAPRTDNRYFYSNIRSLNKSNSTGLLECSNFNTQDSTPHQHPLIDQISMDLYEVSLCCAERIDTSGDDVMLDSGMNNPPIRFPGYSFIPVNYHFECTTTETEVVFPCAILSRPISCLNLNLERNLTSSNGHELPDIKLTGQLSDCQVYINTYTYQLIRGILSQNFGENSLSSVSTTKSFVNDVCWTKFAIDICLNSIQINLFNCSMLPVHLNLANNDNKQFGIINLSDGIISFKYFSNQSTMIKLQCFDISLVEFHEDSTTTEVGQNTILQGLQQQQPTVSSPQAEVAAASPAGNKLAKSPPKLIISLNNSTLNSTLLFYSTSLRLMLNFNWLIQFTSFITLPPLSADVSTSSSVDTLKKSHSSCEHCKPKSQGYYHSYYHTQGCSNNEPLIHPRRQESRSSASVIQNTGLHLCIEDNEVCIPYDERMSLMLKLSANFSRLKSTHTIYGILSDVIQASIQYLRLSRDPLTTSSLSSSSLLFQISDPLKFSSKICHFSIGETLASSPPAPALSPSLSSSSLFLSSPFSLFNNNNNKNDFMANRGTSYLKLIQWSLLPSRLDFGYSVRQRNTLYSGQTQLQLKMTLVAPVIQITSSCADIELIKDCISQLMAKCKSKPSMDRQNDDIGCSNQPSVVVITAFNEDVQSSKRNKSNQQTSLLLLSKFWPTIFADYISKRLISFDFNVDLSLYLLDTQRSTHSTLLSNEENPLLKFNFEGMKILWSKTDSRLNLDCSTVSCFYYNQNLIAWEPILEPWSFSLNWSEKFEKDFSRTILLHWSSQQCLKINLTVPFIHLIRHLLNSINERKSKEQSQHNIQARGGGDINNKLNTSSASNNNPTGSSFLLINQTGTTVRYKVISSQSMNTLLKPEILILEKADNEFIELVKDSQTHLPLKISSFAYKNKLSLNATKLRSEEDGREEQGSDVGNGHTEEEEEDFFQTPRLIIQVSGWKPVYPIALNQLGTYYRILERMPGNADFEILKNQCNECWKYDLPIANRLVIDIVRDPDTQYYKIYLRSALTITNDLNQSIKIGLEIFPKKLPSPLSSSSSVITSSSSSSSSLTLLNTNSSNIEPILLTVCKPNCTYAVPINLAGLMSLGLANLCFSPAKTVMNRQNMTSAVNSISSLGSSSSNKFSDDLYNWAYVYEHHHNDHHQTFDESGGEEEAKLMPSTQHHHHQQQRQSLHPSLSAASMSTATTTAGLSSSTSSSSMLVDFTEDKHRSSVMKMIDWTSLKRPGDLQEAALISTCKLLPPTTRPFPSSIQQQQQRFPSSTSSTSSSPNKKSLTTFTTNKFHMCVAVVRDDQFPLDPQWSSDQLFYANNNSKHLLPISLPSHHITIGPVVRITNLLPCDIFYYFDKTEVNGSLKSKEDTCVYNLFPIQTVNFGIHLDGFPKCDPLSIPPNVYNQKVFIRLFDTLDRPLELQVYVCSTACGIRHLTVSPVICLINNSGLPLIFAQSSNQPNSSLSSPSPSSSSSSSSVFSSFSTAQASVLAAGQYAEHEEACVLMPLLFSFANKSEGYLLRVRIGKGYFSDHDVLDESSKEKVTMNKRKVKRCSWSPGISLDKPGVDTLQLKVYSENNRLSSISYLGFEVQTGQDSCYASTSTIVTFRPRYIVENFTSYHLHITQRYCLTTVNNLPAYVSVHPNCSQSFHWSSEDLDRLLCIRAVVKTLDSSPESINHLSSTVVNSNEPEEIWTLWSGGFQIDRAHSFTIMLRLNHFSQTDLPQSLFFRIVIFLRSATFYVQISDFSHLPPFRLDNASSISVYYCQMVESIELATSNSFVHRSNSYQHHHGSLSSRDHDESNSHDHDNPSNSSVNKWNGGACPSFLIPGSSVPYALEEPSSQPAIILSVQDNISEVYNLNEIGVRKVLHYDNFVYLTIFGPLTDTTEMLSIVNNSSSFSLSPSSRRQSLSLPNLVFDVLPGTNHVVCARKSSRRHSQLWKLAENGLIYHENTSTSPPTTRTKTTRDYQSNRPSSIFSKHKGEFVLDVSCLDDTISHHHQRRQQQQPVEIIDAETLKHFEVVQLIIAKPSKKRKAYQTWRIDQHGLLVNSALFCVQIRRDLVDNMMSTSSSSSAAAAQLFTDIDDIDNFSYIPSLLLAARPRPSATRLISASITSAVILPTWLRPGSGRLRIYTYLDKATRVLRIEDDMDNGDDDNDITHERTGGIDSDGGFTHRRSNSTTMLHSLAVKDKVNSRWGRKASFSTIDTYGQPVQSLWEHSVHQSNMPAATTTTSAKENQFVTNVKINLTLPSGIGLSIISSYTEELIYASFSDINLLLNRKYTNIIDLSKNDRNVVLYHDRDDEVDGEQSTSGYTERGINILSHSHHRMYDYLPSHSGLNSINLSAYHQQSGIDGVGGCITSSAFGDQRQIESSNDDNLDNNDYDNDHADRGQKDRLPVENDVATCGGGDDGVVETKIFEKFNLLIGHFQIDSQFAGALLPVLLFHMNTRLLASSEKIEASNETTMQYPSQHSSIDEVKNPPKLEIMYCRDVQHELPVCLFKIFRIDVYPLNIQAEELLLLKLIQFYQHAFEETNELLYAHHSHRTDSYNDSVTHQRSSTSSPSSPFKNLSTSTRDKRHHSTRISSHKTDQHSIFWFDQFLINPIKMKLSVQTAKSSLTDSHLEGAKRLLPSLMSFTGAEIQLDSIERLYMLGTITQIISYLNAYYRLQLRAHALNIFGSVDFLGNPIGLINDLSSGISGLVELDVGGLIRHVAHGVGDSAAKVAGSVSQLLNVMSFDDKHQQERAIILGSRADSSPYTTYQSNSSSSMSGIGGGSNSSSIGNNFLEGGDLPLNYANESLDDFELTCHDVYLDDDTQSHSTLNTPSSSSPSISSVKPATNQQSFDINRSVTAPLSAGIRGLMHGIVGGMTSIVTQPYRGAKEDQFKGFVYGIGRGLLGTVTKPVGGIFDLVSGMMSSISEAACPSNLYRPRRRRPRRAGLSKYFPRPISVYNLDESVAQLQMYYLTLFTNVQRHSSLQKHHHYSSTSLSSSSSSTLLNPAVITSSSKTFEIGEEILTDINIDDHDDDDNNNHNSSSSKDDNNMTINLSQSTSHMLQTYVLQSCNSATKLPSPHLRYLLNSPESVLCILPVQMTGVIMLITDQAFWCIRDISLKNWIASKNPIHECINMTVQNGQSNLTRGQQPQQPAFYFTENATLMFMLHYHRLDDVYLKLHTSLNAITPLPIHPTNGHILSIDPSSPSAAAATISPPVYVVFTGDSGTSKQQLRCDYLTWGLNLTFQIRKAQFRYIQACMRVNRADVSSLSSPVYSTPSNSNYNQVPRYQNHPVALSYGPICQ